jgi:membrane associated rhomboid family serine protease
MSVEVDTCYRHPDRRAGVTCQRCDRPICPSCMLSASVGFHCPECARGGRQRVYTARTLGTLNRPVVTQVLVAINVAVFIAGSQGGGALSSTAGRYDIDFGLIAHGITRSGAIGVANGEWYRLITGGFLHAGFFHLAMNMLALWLLGSQIERAIGGLRFAAVYFTALLAGSFGVMLVSPNQLTVGASGAIFGLLGLAVANQHARGVNLRQSGLGGILVVNLLITFTPGLNISIGGHLGGLAGGFLCGLVIYRLGPKLQSEALVTALCGAIGLACFAGALVAAQAAL